MIRKVNDVGAVVFYSEISGNIWRAETSKFSSNN